MALQVSHGAWSGSCAHFDRFRRIVMTAWGGQWPKEHGEHWYPPNYRTSKSNPGLFAFFNRSDCDGEIDHTTCRSLALEMLAIAPAIPAASRVVATTDEEVDAFVLAFIRFMVGAATAAFLREPLVFD